MAILLKIQLVPWSLYQQSSDRLFSLLCLPTCSLCSVCLLVLSALSAYLFSLLCLPTCSLCSVCLLVLSALSAYLFSLLCLPTCSLCSVCLLLCSSSMICITSPRRNLKLTALFHFRNSRLRSSWGLFVPLKTLSYGTREWIDDEQSKSTKTINNDVLLRHARHSQLWRNARLARQQPGELFCSFRQPKSMFIYSESDYRKIFCLWSAKLHTRKHGEWDANLFSFYPEYHIKSNTTGHMKSNLLLMELLLLCFIYHSYIVLSNPKC